MGGRDRVECDRILSLDCRTPSMISVYLQAYREFEGESSEASRACYISICPALGDI